MTKPLFPLLFLLLFVTGCGPSLARQRSEVCQEYFAQVSERAKRQMDQVFEDLPGPDRGVERELRIMQIKQSFYREMDQAAPACR